jgi:hypothetical protein
LPALAQAAAPAKDSASLSSKWCTKEDVRTSFWGGFVDYLDCEVVLPPASNTCLFNWLINNYHEKLKLYNQK